MVALLDPVAALRCWTIDVDVAGATYTVPARPAVDWLLAITDGAWADIVPGLLDPDQSGPLEDAIADLAVDPDELRAAAQAALAEAAGTKWWTARTLASAITATPEMVGLLLTRGIDPGHVSLGGYLVAGYSLAVRGMDKMDRARFDMDLQRPPAGVPVEEWWDEDAAADSFMSAMGGGR